MDEITVSVSQARVVVWLDRHYYTQEEMLEAATKALQREMLRLNHEGSPRPWERPF